VPARHKIRRTRVEKRSSADAAARVREFAETLECRVGIGVNLPITFVVFSYQLQSNFMHLLND
jgi:hypothetical protein